MLLGTEIVELWQGGFTFGIVITLLVAFVPAVLSAIWNLWNMVDK